MSLGLWIFASARLPNKLPNLRSKILMGEIKAFRKNFHVFENSVESAMIPYDDDCKTNDEYHMTRLTGI